ncbi:hypothetical protein ACQKGL_22325 [Ensifer adhaerens]|uniref:hypothetical protein n=1 Tax=Ensifer adhaerens TaxID=106592 RepID=UPI003D0042BC
MDGGLAGPDPPTDAHMLRQDIVPMVMAVDPMLGMHGMMAVVDWPADLLEELSLNLRPRRSFSQALRPANPPVHSGKRHDKTYDRCL